jgi:hypothetical protein
MATDRRAAAASTTGMPRYADYRLEIDLRERATELAHLPAAARRKLDGLPWPVRQD